jgi:hypothetical protein
MLIVIMTENLVTSSLSMSLDADRLRLVTLPVPQIEIVWAIKKAVLNASPDPAGSNPPVM